jgi:pimeloyl-ACP methyl ester carboxylesterase
MNDLSRAAVIRGEEHWTTKDGNVKLFMFEKCGGDPNSAAGTVLFVHGSSMASQPTFDLHSSGALRAALFAQRHPQMVARLALDAMVWTGEGSPTLAERKKKLPEFKAKNRRPIDKAFIHSIFDRDHPGTAEEKVIDAFAEAVTALDSSVPTGTYVDMCSKLPVVDPEKITVPTLIMRGQWDGIASLEDLLAFFARLPNPDKHFAVMPGISHASFQQKNYALVYHILWTFFTQPAPIYRG